MKKRRAILRCLVLPILSLTLIGPVSAITLKDIGGYWIHKKYRDSAEPQSEFPEGPEVIKISTKDSLFVHLRKSVWKIVKIEEDPWKLVLESTDTSTPRKMTLYFEVFFGVGGKIKAITFHENSLINQPDLEFVRIPSLFSEQEINSAILEGEYVDEEGQPYSFSNSSSGKSCNAIWPNDSFSYVFAFSTYVDEKCDLIKEPIFDNFDVQYKLRYFKWEGKNLKLFYPNVHEFSQSENCEEPFAVLKSVGPYNKSSHPIAPQQLDKVKQ